MTSNCSGGYETMRLHIRSSRCLRTRTKQRVNSSRCRRSLTTRRHSNSIWREHRPGSTRERFARARSRRPRRRLKPLRRGRRRVRAFGPCAMRSATGRGGKPRSRTEPTGGYAQRWPIVPSSLRRASASAQQSGAQPPMRRRRSCKSICARTTESHDGLRSAGTKRTTKRSGGGLSHWIGAGWR